MAKLSLALALGRAKDCRMATLRTQFLRRAISSKSVQNRGRESASTFCNQGGITARTPRSMLVRALRCVQRWSVR